MMNVYKMFQKVESVQNVLSFTNLQLFHNAKSVQDVPKA